MSGMFLMLFISDFSFGFDSPQRIIIVISSLD